MIQAIADRIFIRLDEPASSPLIIDDSRTPRNTGVVLSTGDKVSSVRTGDHVLFHIFDDLPAYDKDVVTVRENSILGVITND
ncbi:MAG: hypothetical protein IJ529_00125 [Alphaproteobacteria bacterium]|nr:hypothetical protein [Alphaproteobacteria bacterium]MBQ9235113.1 hypothetical protein [Alphaproteobacteria bacterium]